MLGNHVIKTRQLTRRCGNVAVVQNHYQSWRSCCARKL